MDERIFRLANPHRGWTVLAGSAGRRKVSGRCPLKQGPRFSQEEEGLSPFLEPSGLVSRRRAQEFSESSADAVPHAALDWTVSAPIIERLRGADFCGKEQRAKSKGQRAKSKEQRDLSLPPALCPLLLLRFRFWFVLVGDRHSALGVCQLHRHRHRLIVKSLRTATCVLDQHHKIVLVFSEPRHAAALIHDDEQKYLTTCSLHLSNE